MDNWRTAYPQCSLCVLALQERVAQLDFENSALTRAASSKYYPDDIPDNDYGNLDVHALMGKIVKLKGLLDIANQRSESPTDVQGSVISFILLLSVNCLSKDFKKNAMKWFALRQCWFDSD